MVALTTRQAHINDNETRNVDMYLVVVVIRRLVLGHGRERAAPRLDVDAVKHRRAAVLALCDVDHEQVLWALDRRAREVDEERSVHFVAKGSTSGAPPNGRVHAVATEGRTSARDRRRVDVDAVDRVVRERKKRRFDRVGGLLRAGPRVDDRRGLVRLVERRLEDEREGRVLAHVVLDLARLVGLQVDGDVLDLVHEVVGRVRARVKHVVALGAHLARAVDLSVHRVAEACARLAGVPERVDVIERDARGVEALEHVVVVVARGRGDGQLLDVLASAMSAAVVGARGVGARLAGEAVEALALARRAVADAAARALRVTVDEAVRVRRRDPRDFIRALAVRAVAAVLVAHDPVLEARARVIGAARAVARAGVGARRLGGAEEREGEDDARHAWSACPLVLDLFSPLIYRSATGTKKYIYYSRFNEECRFAHDHVVVTSAVFFPRVRLECTCNQA